MSFLRKFIVFMCIANFSFADEDIRLFLKMLPKEQKTTLEWFFRNCLQSFSGYVLCGDKPMCIEEIAKGSHSLNFSEWLYAKITAFQILKEWNSREDNEYIFLSCDWHNYLHTIVINRKEFIKTVNENISLFRYVLGRTLTAEGLLRELIKNQNQFWNVLNDNRVLIGVLLGYGTNNALICSRAEDLGKDYKLPKVEQFPYFYTSIESHPSLGFTSLEEERNVLNKLQKYSRDILAYRTYPIPCFGCEPESEETRFLLDRYEKNRAQIMELAQQENFLEKVLEKIFMTTSGNLRIPKVLTMDSPLKGNLSGSFAEIIRSEAEIKGLKRDVLLKSFLKGVEDREKKQKLLQEDNNSQGLILGEIIPTQIECCKNLLSANQWFQKTSEDKEWISLIPHGILYKVLKIGQGPSASAKIKKATFHLSFRLGLENNYTDYKTVKDGDIEKLVPGIAYSLIGMKRGEQRTICLHPKYAYGIHTQPFNAMFFVDLQLIDFEEGDTEAQILPSSDLEPTYYSMSQEDHVQKPLPPLGLDTLEIQHLEKIYKNLLKKNQEINNSRFYRYGYSFWDLIKSKCDFIKIEDFSKQLLGSSNYFKDSKQRDEFVRNFKVSLFIENYRNGKEPPFPLSWF